MMMMIIKSIGDDICGETEVDLKEIVQDAAGEWIERPTKLELQEAAQRQGQQGSKR